MTAPMRTEKSRLLAGFEDPNGARWYRFGTPQRSILFSQHDLQVTPAKVFSQMATVGSAPITNAAKERFKKDVEDYVAFEQASIISRPGWSQSAYAHGDGTVSSLRRLMDSSHVGFDGDSRFGAAGSLSRWQAAFGPIVRDQPLPLFLFSFAFVGPLLRFAPPDYQNAFVEVAGEPQSGKTAICVAASSVWGGNPDSSIGFGVSWDQTMQSLDDVKGFHRDGLLFLDEANHTGTSKRAQSEFLHGAIFKLLDTSPRRRFGDGHMPDHSKLAILSTSNAPIRDLVGQQSGSARAVLSRVLTLHATRRYGIFDFVPEGFASAREAAEALQGAANNAYGVAGRAFIGKLVRYKAHRVSGKLRNGLQSEKMQELLRGVADPRISKILALTYMAGHFAQQLDIVPRDWGSVQDAVAAMIPLSDTSVPKSAVDSIKAYIADYGRDFIAVGDPCLPLGLNAFADCPGFWTELDRKLVISVNRFRRHFPHADAVLEALREKGRLDADQGNYSKKASLKLCNVGRRPRAYYIEVGPE